VPKENHIPERTCVSCGDKNSKQQMIRLVRGIDGNISVDQTGRNHGRGCYVCKSQKCWEKDTLTANISKGLRISVSQSTKESLTRTVNQNFLINEPKD
jgi:predicted RNA-binding protein YlxR (DUF448 family)